MKLQLFLLLPLLLFLLTEGITGPCPRPRNRHNCRSYNDPDVVIVKITQGIGQQGNMTAVQRNRRTDQPGHIAECLSASSSKILCILPFLLASSSSTSSSSSREIVGDGVNVALKRSERKCIEMEVGVSIEKN